MTGNSSEPRRVAYRLREVSAMSGLGLRTIQRMVASGDLVAHRCGKVVVVFQADLAAWLGGFEPVTGAELGDAA